MPQKKNPVEADVRRNGKAIEVLLPDGKVIGEILPTVRYGIHGVRISSSTIDDDQWLPGVAAAVKRICRRNNIAPPYYRGGSGVRLARGFKAVPPGPEASMEGWTLE